MPDLRREARAGRSGPFTPPAHQSRFVKAMRHPSARSVSNVAITSTASLGYPGGSTIANGVAYARDHALLRHLYGRSRLLTGFPNDGFVSIDQFHYDGTTPGAGGIAGGEVVYDGRYIEFYQKDTGNEIYLFVDGVLASETSFPGYGGQTGATGYLKLDFGSAARRRLRIVNPAWVGGVVIEPGYSLYDPAPVRPCNMVVFGDSISEGTGASIALNGFVPLLGELLGVDNCWASALGGTGYVTTNGSWVNLKDRIDRDLTLAPADGIDAILFTMGINDPAGISDNVAYCFAAARARWPNATLMASGPLHGYDIGAVQQEKADIIEAHCRTYGVGFIDCSDWITSADTAAYFPGGYGDPHPNDAGHAYYASKFNEAIRGLTRRGPVFARIGRAGAGRNRIARSH